MDEAKFCSEQSLKAPWNRGGDRYTGVGHRKEI